MPVLATLGAGVIKALGAIGKGAATAAKGATTVAAKAGPVAAKGAGTAAKAAPEVAQAAGKTAATAGKTVAAPVAAPSIPKLAPDAIANKASPDWLKNQKIQAKKDWISDQWEKSEPYREEAEKGALSSDWSDPIESYLEGSESGAAPVSGGESLSKSEMIEKARQAAVRDSLG